MLRRTRTDPILIELAERGRRPADNLVPEGEKLRREVARMDYEAFISSSAERVRFQQEIGTNAIRSMMLANGGAILALLTFVGNSRKTFDAGDLFWAFSCFGAGVALSLLSYFAAYFSQAFFIDHDVYTAWNNQDELVSGEPRFSRQAAQGWTKGNVVIWVAILLLLAALGTFVAGSYFALNGIL